MRPRLRHNSIMPVLLTVLLLAACSPLRRTQRNRKADSTAVDRTEIRKAVHDILHESGTLSQTVVEFFPPIVAPVGVAPTLAGPDSVASQKAKDVWRHTSPDGKPELRPARPSAPEPDWAGGVGATFQPEALIVEPAAPQPPAIRRIVHTEIAAEREQETTTDSLANNDIHTATHNELSDKVAEKPPARTMTIRWIAIALSAVAAIILLLKFPKIKLPF